MEERPQNAGPAAFLPPPLEGVPEIFREALEEPAFDPPYEIVGQVGGERRVGE